MDGLDGGNGTSAFKTSRQRMRALFPTLHCTVRCVNAAALSPKPQPSAVSRAAGHGGGGGSRSQEGETERDRGARNRPYQPPPRRDSLHCHLPPPHRRRRAHRRWRSAPLNLDDEHIPGQAHDRVAVISKVLSEHRSLFPSLRSIFAELDGWLRSPALNNLREMEIVVGCNDQLMPSSPLGFAPTLRAARFDCCRFLEDGTPALGFPHLKQLVLENVVVSDDALHGVLSGCPAIESLLLSWCKGFSRVLINSPTRRSIGVCVDGLDELVIENAPRLERLIRFDSDFYGTPLIRIISAPKREILGSLGGDFAKL